MGPIRERDGSVKHICRMDSPEIQRSRIPNYFYPKTINSQNYLKKGNESKSRENHVITPKKKKLPLKTTFENPNETQLSLSSNFTPSPFPAPLPPYKFFSPPSLTLSSITLSLS